MTLAMAFVPLPMQGNPGMQPFDYARSIPHRFPMFPGGSLYDSAIYTLGDEKGRIVSRGGRVVGRGRLLAPSDPLLFPGGCRPLDPR